MSALIANADMLSLLYSLSHPKHVQSKTDPKDSSGHGCGDHPA